MSRRRFVAPTMDEAMRLISETMGSDAYIISNQKTAEGIEVVASTEEIIPPTREIKTPNVLPAESNVESELKDLRNLLELQLGSLAWSQQEQQNPARASVFQRLVTLDIEPQLARKIISQQVSADNGQEAWEQCLDYFKQNLSVVKNDILEEGGVVALVGPTGVGKTTTIAKLATRFALQRGSEQIGLITTDSRRIGGHEQLRTYGKLLGIANRVISTRDEFLAALRAFRNKQLVLIDTAGVSQADQNFQEQAAITTQTDIDIQHYMVLSATHQGSALERSLEAIKHIKINGSIITKLDEADRLGPLMTLLINRKIPLAYFSQGQRVPEDLQIANVASLLELAIQRAGHFSGLAQKDDLALSFRKGVSHVDN